MTRMTTGMGLVVMLLSPSAPAADPEVPFTGIVIQDKVEVRSGAGTAYYTVGALDKGSIVQVDEVLYGWHKVVCPKGLYSYISKAFVDAKGDGKIGHVNSDRAEIKAASIHGPGHSIRVQVVLDEGQTVQIVDEEGSFYKIVPPQAAFVFLPPSSVRRASALELVAEPPATGVTPPQSPTQEQTTPLAEPPDQQPPATEPELMAQPAPGPGPVIAQEAALTEELPVTPAEPAAVLVGPIADRTTTPAPSGRLRDLDTRMLPLFLKPLEQQPIDRMIEAYERLLQDQSLPEDDRQIVARRLAALRHNQHWAEALRPITEAKMQIEPTESPVQTQPTVRYGAVGRLVASRVYDGQRLPRMFRLVDPLSHRTIAYVEPGGPIQARKVLGQIVGIVGDQQYDAALKLHVMLVSRVDILEARE